MKKLYTIDCLQGAPLSSWSEPATLKNILDRYYEQHCDQSDEPMARKDFTAEVFQDLWECRLVELTDKDITERLEYLRGELRAERISYGELSELAALADRIEDGDVELLEAAGVPEGTR